MLSAQGIVSPTIQSNGKMSDEFMYLSWQLASNVANERPFSMCSNLKATFFLNENIIYSFLFLLRFLSINSFNFRASSKNGYNIKHTLQSFLTK